MSENTKPKKVILDVDTGSDDAVAIMTALQSLYHRAGREGKSFPSYG